MGLRPLYGHEALRGRLASAVDAGRLPQSILFEGPQGVGKQRLALWLAQIILCELDRQGDSCTCRSCRFVTNLSHPDLYWFVPLEPSRRGGSGDADKQVEQVETALGEEMAARRDQPLYGSLSGMAVHTVAAVRQLLRRLALTPHMGKQKVFIVGDAERLVPQRSSPEAANALLKALEEPPADSVLILTTPEPSLLPPTILSRVVRVRVHRVPDSVVTSFAQKHLPSVGNLGRAVQNADGCIGRLLAQTGPVGGSAAGNAGEPFLAALEGSAVERYAAALRQTPFQARGGFTDMLDELVERLRRKARDGGETRRITEAIALVLEAREQAQGNVNPQLLAAVLADDLVEHR